MIRLISTVMQFEQVPLTDPPDTPKSSRCGPVPRAKERPYASLHSVASSRGSFSCLSMKEDPQPEVSISECFRDSECKKKAQRFRALATERNPQWLINLGLAPGPRLCKMCQKNPAEFSGFCGDCYNKLEKSKKTPARKHWLVALSHFFE